MCRSRVALKQAQTAFVLALVAVWFSVATNALVGKKNLNLVRKPQARSGSDKDPREQDVARNRSPSPANLRKEGKPKRKFRANGVIMPRHWVRSQDPDHPEMKTYIKKEKAHTLSLMPENTYWKDHDSENDGVHPNWAVIRQEAMNSSECDRDDWNIIGEQFDLHRWTDENYNKTIEKYGLQDFDRVKSTVPKLWFEPFSSSELEEYAEEEILEPARGEFIPHYGEPFCQRCESVLGMARPSLRLEHDRFDPRCRHCGFVNVHGPDGRLLCDPEVHVTQVPPSDLMWKLQEEEMDRHIDAVNAMDPEEDGARVPDLRLTVEQRCDECGHTEAYYRTAQVRGADEGQTAFFQCVRCKHQWTIKG